MRIQSKTSDARKKAVLKYQNKFYRPNVLIDADKKNIITLRYIELGFQSVNQYITHLINKDLEKMQK